MPCWSSETDSACEEENRAENSIELMMMIHRCTEYGLQVDTGWLQAISTARPPFDLCYGPGASRYDVYIGGGRSLKSGCSKGGCVNFIV